jgi:hypothetical protein
MTGKRNLVNKRKDLQGTLGRPPKRSRPKTKRIIKRWGLSGFFDLKKWRAGFKFDREVIIEIETDDESKR